MKKKTIALLLTLAMVMSFAVCGSTAAFAKGVSITIFNSKMEIQSQMEEMAEIYSDATGVDVEVYYSSDTVAAHMST
nr:carbohydrate ABC transporter substrate-binding protein [Oscillospiraceae bacterium]